MPDADTERERWLEGGGLTREWNCAPPSPTQCPAFAWRLEAYSIVKTIPGDVGAKNSPKPGGLVVGWG